MRMPHRPGFVMISRASCDKTDLYQSRPAGLMMPTVGTGTETGMIFKFRSLSPEARRHNKRRPASSDEFIVQLTVTWYLLSFKQSVASFRALCYSGFDPPRRPGEADENGLTGQFPVCWLAGMDFCPWLPHIGSLIVR